MNKVIASASIVVGNTTTNPIQLNSYIPTGLIISGSVVTSSALTFLVSDDGTTYYPLYDDLSSEVSLVDANVARAYKLDATVFSAWNFMKIREGNSASAVAQATYNALFKLIMQPF